MGTYKVPQNVEAEDKILGPLSLKQFIYALIGLAWGFLTFALFRQVIVLWVLIGIPPALFLLALGLYQKEDQPLETFVIAIFQFLVRPKTRLWHKEPIAEVFRLEPPPPKAEIAHRDPREVRGQLQRLAELVDTRGWSAKQPELQEAGDEAPVIDLMDRIGAGALVPQQTPSLGGAAVLTPAPAGMVAAPATTDAPAAPNPGDPGITEEDDILAEGGQVSQNLNTLIQNSVKSMRAEAVERMKKPTAPVAAKKVSPTTPSTSGLTAPLSGDILKLATEGGDLTVAQIAAQAHRKQDLVEGQTVQVRNGNTTTTTS
ncbi:PrgI family protein [Patescibacteria group bacterium]|nr:MAG: PrgI family protein [Patescibacteria group bacterium]